MVFSDYLKPAIRLAALMELPVIYPFTHDSIAVGEDGPTHQPIEQLSMFRSMPNTNVFRPCDANETQAAWQVAYESTKTPSILSLTRQNLENVTADSYSDVLANFKKGAYVILDVENVEHILIASGSEVKLAIDVAKKLGNTRVVSMPCQELYDAQSAEYKEEILPKNIDKTYIELGATNGNYKYANNVIGMDTFGRSGEASTVLTYFDFTVDKIAERIECQK
jgi:transketolase